MEKGEWLRLRIKTEEVRLRDAMGGPDGRWARALEEILYEGHLQGATQPVRQRDAVVLGSLLMCGLEL